MVILRKYLFQEQITPAVKADRAILLHTICVTKVLLQSTFDIITYICSHQRECIDTLLLLASTHGTSRFVDQTLILEAFRGLDDEVKTKYSMMEQ